MANVVAKMPRIVKKRRKVTDEEGVETWEEYRDYIFADDEGDRPNFKLLAMAHEWKMKMAAEGKRKRDDDEEEESSEEEEESGDEED